MKSNNTFLGYEQDDKFLFVRPANIITIYQWGAEYILETDKKQHVVKDEESACLIDSQSDSVTITGEYKGYVTTRADKNISGAIVKAVGRTTTRKPNLNAAKRWLSLRDPEFQRRRVSLVLSLGDLGVIIWQRRGIKHETQ